MFPCQIFKKINSVDLTEKGIELITSSGEDQHFFIIPDVGSSIADEKGRNALVAKVWRGKATGEPL